MKKVFALILCVSLLLCGCSAAPQSIKDDNPVVPETVKSVWMAYFELEKYTSECTDSNSFESEIKSAFKKVKSLGLNTITVQVRPCADAFYKSSYFPVSKYCFGVQGSELIYDPLAIMVKAAHNLGLRIEAWVNPYRVSQENDINALSSGNPAKKWLEDTEKSSCVYVADKIYFNPARSEVTELIVNGVKEIVKNYAVDGIHFDDYFYPTTNEEIDEKEYSQYQSSGGDMGLSDWRRNNVCEMIKAVYKAVKEENSSVMFGISPQSKVSTDYSTLYADVEKWASEPGYADYICPQIYFGFYNEVQPFTRTAKEWSERTTAVKLYVGLPLYKAGKEDNFASADQSYAINEFVENSNIISRQIAYLSQLNNVGGYYIYSFSYLVEPQDDATAAEVENIKNLN